jgi:6-phosphogluconolactonase
MAYVLRTTGDFMKIEIYADEDAVSRAAAAIIADEARAAISRRGRFIMAVSGGHTPWLMLRALSEAALAWDKIHVVQVDERVAPAGDPERNLTHLRKSLLSHASLRQDHIHPMPVEAADLRPTAKSYAEILEALAGTPAVLDLIHLGLGKDGHTASLVPGDPVLDIDDRDVASTLPFQGRCRMTLTFPVINRARRILWLVTGRDKAEALQRLRDADLSIPASRVRRDVALIVADRAAAGQSRPIDGEP